ncbi:MAG: VWA domain-containing protein [Candidatus Acidiferrales bacterium]
MRSLTLLIAIAFLAPLRGGRAAQNSIHSDVNLVSVSFTARNTSGALVDNLTKDDFDVFEDAVGQKIAFFARSADVPLTLGLILDASGSQEHFVKKHQRDLQVFLDDVLGPRDHVFLLCFGNHLRLVSDFMQSGPTMLDGLRAYDHDSGKFPELGPKEDRDLGTAFYDAIYYSVSEKLAAQTGRRALLVFSDGEDNSSSHDMMTTIETAQQENVQVFTIRYTQREHGRLTARNKYGISVMDRIAKETGGESIDARTTDPHTYFHQIADELRNSYELAYYPTNPIKDDTFRKIVIRPKQDSLTVLAKTGYFARPRT